MNDKPKIQLLLDKIKWRRSAKNKKSSRRKIDQHRYKSFALQKKLKSTKTGIPPSWKILNESIGIFRNNWKPILGLAVVYQILVTVLVKNLGISVGLEDLEKQLQTSLSGNPNSELVTGAILLGTLFGSGTRAATETGSIYQLMLFVVFSLAFIWLVRQILAGHKVGIRDALYKGMYPLIPFVMILLVIVIQLLPMAAATFVYSIVMSNGIAVNMLEHAVWLLLTLSFVTLSLYLVSSSLFALYIVTLPDTKPWQALKAARGLVRHRRAKVFRKVIFLPISLILLGIAMLIPFVVFWPWLAEWVFYVLTMIAFIIGHIYIYSLYRKLIA